ncbi:MAG: quinone-dependent dihydroorotate dehydrogenase [Pseudomonadota bacterium]
MRFKLNVKRILGELAGASLRVLPAEMAHDLGMLILKHRLARFLPRPADTLAVPHDLDLHIKIPGWGDLAHPIGLAAGFDKNAIALKGFEDLGFSFLEVGTVTPIAQPGNPKPRMFRSKSEYSLINRMGFNNDGHRAVYDRVEGSPLTIPVGVNLGKNKQTLTEHAISDYLKGLIHFKNLGSYIVINISSPNTPGLRELANPEFIRRLKSEIEMQVPELLKKIWIKLDPDLPRKEFISLIETITEERFAGLILSNTHRVTWPEAGGMSGHVLSHLSSERMTWAYEVHRGALPMIGSGGVMSGIDVFHKLARGASAVQIYTALVYRGPWAVLHMLEEFKAEMLLHGYTRASDVIGCHYRD